MNALICCAGDYVAGVRMETPTLIVSAALACQMSQIEQRDGEDFVDFFARVLDALDDSAPDIAGAGED